MPRPFVYVALALTAAMAFILGVTSGSRRAPVPAAAPAPAVEAVSEPPHDAILPSASAVAPPAAAPQPVRAAGLVNFADVAAVLNPAVVNIEATTRGGSRRRRPAEPSPFDEVNPAPQTPGVVRPQSGS